MSTTATNPKVSNPQPTTHKTTKHRLRMGAGLHYANDASGKERMYRPGDVVESPTNLSERWPEKFERVFDDNPVSAGNPQTVDNDLTEIDSVPVETTTDTLESMSLDQLRKLAQEEEIDLRGAKTKADVIKVIRAAQLD